MPSSLDVSSQIARGCAALLLLLVLFSVATGCDTGTLGPTPDSLGPDDPAIPQTLFSWGFCPECRDLGPGQIADVQAWINAIEDMDPLCRGAKAYLQDRLDNGKILLGDGGHHAVTAWYGSGHPNHEPLEVWLNEDSFWGSNPALSGNESWALVHVGTACVHA